MAIRPRLELDDGTWTFSRRGAFQHKERILPWNTMRHQVADMTFGAGLATT